jgi:hypothetical protein
MLVFFAQCPDETTVMTCYTLKDSVRCHCPLTESKGGL